MHLRENGLQVKLPDNTIPALDIHIQEKFNLLKSPVPQFFPQHYPQKPRYRINLDNHY